MTALSRVLFGIYYKKQVRYYNEKINHCITILNTGTFCGLGDDQHKLIIELKRFVSFLFNI